MLALIKEEEEEEEEAAAKPARKQKNKRKKAKKKNKPDTVVSAPQEVQLMRQSLINLSSYPRSKLLHD